MSSPFIRSDSRRRGSVPRPPATEDTEPERARAQRRSRTNPPAAGSSAAAAAPTSGSVATAHKPAPGASLRAFSDAAAVDRFLADLAGELSALTARPQAIFKQEEDPADALGKALEVLSSTMGTLDDVQSRASRHVDFLTEEMEVHERRLLDATAEAERGLEKAAADFRALDAASSGLVAAATTTGARLSTAHKVTLAAKRALGLLQHLWDFSLAPTAAVAAGDTEALRGAVDAVFIDDASVAQAAALLTDMLALARELHSSQLRLGLAGEDIDAAPVASAGAALRNLLAYRNQLENRLVVHFMASCTHDPPDLRGMRRCCHNLAYLGEEAAAVKGYVAMMPLFASSGPPFIAPPWRVADDTEQRTYAVRTALSQLLDALRRERATFEQVFERWQDALETLAIRVVEEKADQVVAAALAPPDAVAATGGADDPAGQASVLAAYLGMLHPVKVAIVEFCGAVEELLPKQVGVKESLEGMQSILQTNYPPVEQRYLSLLWRQHAATKRAAADEAAAAAAVLDAQRGADAEPVSVAAAAGGAQGVGSRARAAASYLKAGVAAVRARMGPTAASEHDAALVDADEVGVFASWHRKACTRAVMLLPPVVAAMHIARYFHRKAPDLPPCCLLDQSITSSLAGITAASRRTATALKAPFAPAPTGADGAPLPAANAARLSAAAIGEAAEAYLAGGALDVFEAATKTGKVVEAVQRHFVSSVSPNLAPRPAAAAESAHALSHFSAALESAIESGLTGAADALDAQLARLLATEQRRADFQPSEVDSGRLDRPTHACLLVTGLVRGVADGVRSTLHREAAAGFLSEVGSRLYTLLLQHMLKFRYSMFGALQWKRDMSEYQTTTARFEVVAVDELAEQALQLANTLIVPPASLLEVIDTALQMDRATARRYIALREDYASARVDGRPLAQLLGDAAVGAAGGTGGRMFGH